MEDFYAALQYNYSKCKLASIVYRRFSNWIAAGALQLDMLLRWLIVVVSRVSAVAGHVT